MSSIQLSASRSPLAVSDVTRQFADVELRLADEPGMDGASVRVELRSAGKCQPLELVFGQPLLVKNLLVGQSYTLNVLPTCINNIILSHLSKPAALIPVANKTLRHTVSFLKENSDRSGLVEVNATVLGLPKGCQAQRYVFRSNRGTGMFQYSLMLESDTDLQHVAIPMCAGYYALKPVSLHQDEQRWFSDFSASYGILQSTNIITLPFEKEPDLPL
jgi:hypothetical protein